MGRRGAIVELINTFTGHSIGAEIGVAHGRLSKYMLVDCPIVRHLFLIDPWQHGYAKTNDSNDVSQAKMDQRYEKVCGLTKRFPGRVTVKRMTSVEAAAVLPNLDFVFIDGNHSYEAVTQDLEVWVPKINSHGLIMGDDWSGHWPSVVKAVTDFGETTDAFMTPFLDYSQFNFAYEHFGAPARNPVVNKSNKVWWAIKKDNTLV